MKRLCGISLAILLLIGIAIVHPKAVSAETSVKIEHNLPEEIQIGEDLSGYVLKVTGLKNHAGKNLFVYLSSNQPSGRIYYYSSHTGGVDNPIAEDGTVTAPIFLLAGPAYSSGTESLILDIGLTSTDMIKLDKIYEEQFHRNPSDRYDAQGHPNWSQEEIDHYHTWFEKQINAAHTVLQTQITVHVKKPEIQTNAPKSVKTGTSFCLQTELTGTALKNTDTAYYLDEKNYDFSSSLGSVRLPMLKIDASLPSPHTPAYQPSVEILEGGDIVKQAEQDYSNTLKSSERLTFTGTGTVKLKITYKQFVTCGPCQMLQDPNNNYQVIGFRTYNPEKIVTIHVTKDGKPPILESPNKSDLQNLISQNSKLHASDYTTASYQAFSSALNHAKEVLNSPNATPEEVDKATEHLKKMIEGLKTAEGHEEPASSTVQGISFKTDLQNLVSKNLELYASDYTIDSYHKFSIAMEQAKTVLNNPNATEKEIIQARENLLTAVQSLKPDKNPSPSLSRPEENNEISSYHQSPVPASSYPSNSSSNPAVPPQTGGNNAVVFFILLTVVSGAMILLARTFHRNKTHE